MATARLRKFAVRNRRPVRKSPLLRIRREMTGQSSHPADVIPMDKTTRDAFTYGEMMGNLFAASQRMDLVRLAAFVRGCESGMNELS